MFRFLAALAVVMLHTVLVVPNAAQSDCNACVSLSAKASVFEIQMPDSYFRPEQCGTCRWTFTQMDPHFFIQINITKLSLLRFGNCVDRLTIRINCSSVVSNIIELGCERPLPSTLEIDAGCNLTIIVFKLGTLPRHPTFHGFNAILSLVSAASTKPSSTKIVTSTDVSTISTPESTRANIILSTEVSTEHKESSSMDIITSTKVSPEATESSKANSIASTEESNHASNQSAKVILPIALVILIIIIITLLLVLVVRFKWIRKTNENEMSGTSFTNSAYSQNEIMSSTTLGKHDQVNGITIERNEKTDQKNGKDLDHLEGEGVVSNPVYGSSAEKDQEHAYQSAESNDLSKQHEYAYVDSEFLRDGQLKMTYERSNNQTTPNTTVSVSKTADGNLYHLEGDGVEYNPIYASN